MAVDLVAGRSPRSAPNVLAPFPPQPPDSLFWASGDFELLDLRAPGDGSHTHNSGFFFATGAAGLAATAAVAVGRAAEQRPAQGRCRGHRAQMDGDR